jgi:hypothetical protein
MFEIRSLIDEEGLEWKTEKLELKICASQSLKHRSLNMYNNHRAPVRQTNKNSKRVAERNL